MPAVSAEPGQAFERGNSFGNSEERSEAEFRQREAILTFHANDMMMMMITGKVKLTSSVKKLPLPCVQAEFSC